MHLEPKITTIITGTMGAVAGGGVAVAAVMESLPVAVVAAAFSLAAVALKKYQQGQAPLEKRHAADRRQAARF